MKDLNHEFSCSLKLHSLKFSVPYCVECDRICGQKHRTNSGSSFWSILISKTIFAFSCIQCFHMFCQCCVHQTGGSASDPNRKNRKYLYVLLTLSGWLYAGFYKEVTVVDFRSVALLMQKNTPLNISIYFVRCSKSHRNVFAADCFTDLSFRCEIILP